MSVRQFESVFEQPPPQRQPQRFAQRTVIGAAATRHTPLRPKFGWIRKENRIPHKKENCFPIRTCWEAGWLALSVRSHLFLFYTDDFRGFHTKKRLKTFRSYRNWRVFCVILGILSQARRRNRSAEKESNWFRWGRKLIALENIGLFFQMICRIFQKTPKCGIVFLAYF